MCHSLTLKVFSYTTITSRGAVLISCLQSLIKQWEKYAGEVSRVKGQKVTLPSYDKVLISTELVLDDQGQLREGNRVHGENEVR